MPPKNRFTIYDALERSGYFEKNPANSDSRDQTTGENLYLGPVQYPKMLYHPEGEQRTIVPPEVIVTPFGPKEVNEQRELIWRTVADEEEEQELLFEGWHDHPAKAIRKRVEASIEALGDDITPLQRKRLMASIPPISSGARIVALESELARVKELLAQQQAMQEEIP